MQAKIRHLGILAGVLVGLSGPVDLDADEAARVTDAVRRALPLLRTASQGSAEHRACFMCHGQALPVFSLQHASSRGFDISQESVTEPAEHTLAYLESGRERYRKGTGQGGRADMAGYALWTLAAAGFDADETTADVVDFLIGYRDEEEYWPPSSKRPPSEGSRFATTYLALRGIRDFGSAEQKSRASEREQRARNWLLKTPASDTEDQVFRLRALGLVSPNHGLRRQLAAELVAAQRDDGGWSQTSELPSDAYATGTVLATLAEESLLAPSNPVYRRGLRFLLSTQAADGSWFVKSRSKPFQKYFESGFPHGTDQYISTSATGWATIALLKSLPKMTPGIPPQCLDPSAEKSARNSFNRGVLRSR